jgi:hypothetical protein
MLKYISVLIIGLVSIYDIYLTIIFAEYIHYLEQSLISRYIISRFDVNVFIFTKSISTLMTCLFCCYLLNTKYKICVYAVMVFQIGLFFYLTYSTPTQCNSKETITPFTEFINLINGG